MIRFNSNHYQAIANVLKSSKPVPQLANYKDQLNQWNATVEEFVGYFEINSPVFNKGRFLKACGYESELSDRDKETLERQGF